jgi:hypothetical protein
MKDDTQTRFRLTSERLKVARQAVTKDEERRDETLAACSTFEIESVSQRVDKDIREPSAWRI